MKENLIKLKEIFIEMDIMFLCNCVYYLGLSRNESQLLSDYLEKHKPKKIPENNGGGWFELHDKESRIEFLDKLIKEL